MISIFSKRFIGMSLIGLMASFAVLGLFAPSAFAADNALVSMTMLDTDTDGKIDRIQVSIDNDSTNTAAIHDTTGWSVTDGGNAVDIDTVALASAADADPLLINVDLDTDDTDLGIDTANSDLEVIYVQQGVDAGTEYNDGANTQLLAISTGDTGTEDEVDAANPVVVSTVPADGGTPSRYTSIAITFSEAMDTTFDEGTEFSVSPDPGTFSESWSAGDTVVTLDLAEVLLCATTYTVATDEGEIDAAAGSPTSLLTTGPEDGDWSFFVVCGSSSGGGGTEAPTYSALVVSPNGGETFTPGAETTINWSTGGTGTLDYVDLFFSTDGGDTYSVIADGTDNDGSYMWTVPNVLTSEALIRVEAHNNLDVLASDESDVTFAIMSEEEEEETTPPVTETPSEVTEPGSGTYGPSPVTGLTEEISVVSPHDVLRSPYFDTVYYVDENLVRHPFFNNQIYATWYDDFSNVKVVTDATLPTLPLGATMLPKPGTVWVKIQSVPNTYLIEANSSDPFKPTLRWVTNEAIANELIGPDWADYIIDIDPALFNRFNFGSNVLNAASATVDVEMMKKRVELNI